MKRKFVCALLVSAVVGIAGSVSAAPHGGGRGGGGGWHDGGRGGGWHRGGWHGGGWHRGGYHGGGWHGGGWHRNWWWGGLYWAAPLVSYSYAYPAYVYPYTYSYPYSYQERVVVEQQQPAVQAQPPVAMWYYCDRPGGYYPYVSDCPEGWRTVPATPPDGDAVPRSRKR